MASGWCKSRRIYGQGHHATPFQGAAKATVVPSGLSTPTGRLERVHKLKIN